MKITYEQSLTPSITTYSEEGRARIPSLLLATPKLSSPLSLCQLIFDSIDHSLLETLSFLGFQSTMLSELFS